MGAVYYLSIQYAPKNPDGTVPEGYDMEFSDSKGFVGKRVTRIRHSNQIPVSKMKLLSSNEHFSPFRSNMRMCEDIYEITKKTFDEMEDKPELKKIIVPNCKNNIGWQEINHQDEYSEVKYFLVKGLK